MAYATPDDMIARFDVRTLGDLSADDGSQVSASGLATNAKIIACLSDASGQVEAACLQGERYTIEDLGGLTGDSESFLVRIVCDLALGYLWRRKLYVEENAARLESVQRADEHLTRLRSGEWVFDVTEVKEAGRAKVRTITRQEVSNNYHLFVDRVRGKLYPRRRSYRDR